MNPLEGISSIASHEAEKLLDRYVSGLTSQLIIVCFDYIGWIVGSKEDYIPQAQAEDDD